MPIEEIGLDDQGYPFVRPSAASADEFTHIYRAAMGIRWKVGYAHFMRMSRRVSLRQTLTGRLLPLSFRSTEFGCGLCRAQYGAASLLRCASQSKPPVTICLPTDIGA
jgi:hypothetical protein